jgi:hypothetical protein
MYCYILCSITCQTICIVIKLYVPLSARQYVLSYFMFHYLPGNMYCYILCFIICQAICFVIIYQAICILYLCSIICQTICIVIMYVPKKKIAIYRDSKKGSGTVINSAKFWSHFESTYHFLDKVFRKQFCTRHGRKLRHLHHTIIFRFRHAV